MNSHGPAADPTPTYHAADAAPAGNISQLIAGVLEDSTTLIKQHLVMLQAEVKEDVSRTVAAGKYMGVGVGVAAVGFAFILIGVPLLLHYLVPELPLWACWMIVGTVLIVLGGIGFLVGKRLMARFSPLPDKTLNALSENMSWITKRQN